MSRIGRGHFSWCQPCTRGDTKNCYIGSCTNFINHAIEAMQMNLRLIENIEKVRVNEEKLKSQIAFLRSSATKPFSDVSLVASDDPESPSSSISANRAILASRSPVFRAMLENKMEESISGIIKIGEVSSDSLAMFVDFLYTGEAALDDQKACDLLILGEKYQIPHLKNYCELFLRSALNWDNALPIYAFSRQNNCQILRDVSLALIVKDIRKLSKRQDYAQFVEKDPGMLLEIYEVGNDDRARGAVAYSEVDTLPRLSIYYVPNYQG